MAQPINPNQQSRGEQAAWSGLFSDDPAIKADANVRYIIALRFRQGGLDLSPDEIDAWVAYRSSLGGTSIEMQSYATELSDFAAAQQIAPPLPQAERDALERIESDRQAAILAAQVEASYAEAQARVEAEGARIMALAETDRATAYAIMQQQLAAQAEREAQIRFEDDRQTMAAQQQQASLEMQQRDALEAYAVEVRADVADMYRQILKREADQGGLDYWTDVIVSGNATGELVAVSLSQSDEAMILGAYEQYLHRIPSIDERDYWTGVIAQGFLSANAAVDAIRNSEEARSYAYAIVPTPGADPLIVQTVNPATGSTEAIDPVMGTNTWGTAYNNQDMIAADPVASPVVELQNYYAPDVNISDLEPVSPMGDTSPALAFKAREEIYKAYTTSLRREPSEADYQYWEPLLVSKAVSLSDFKRYVDESDEAEAIKSRSQAVTLEQAQAQAPATTPPTEGIGAAFGVISAIAFFLGQS